MLPLHRSTQPQVSAEAPARSAFTPRGKADLPLSPLSAVIYCEGQFGRSDGKTANGLVRHSAHYRIVSVVDSTLAGQDTGIVLDGTPNGIPIFASLADAISKHGAVPANLICGFAPADGRLKPAEREALLDGLSWGMHLVNGLHEFLGDDQEFSAAAHIAKVDIVDVRKPKPRDELVMFTGRIAEVTCPRIAVLGTDGSVGKRTTALTLTRALIDHGIRAAFVGTGQTSIMQGAAYGVALDAILPQFCSGEIEAEVVRAFDTERPDIILVEGQGALSHPAYLSSAAIIRGTLPHGIIVQHAPKREVRDDFPMIRVPDIPSEITLIETFANAPVIGITLNHEGMSAGEIRATIQRYQAELGLPVTDPLTRPARELVDMVLQAFPTLASGSTP